MKTKVLLRGPILSRSGYGEQARFALRSLRAFEGHLDIFVDITSWGATNWTIEDTEEKNWIDQLALKTAQHSQQGGQFDASLQVTIPNEWEKLAKYNVGYTAGIETTMIAPQWIEKANMMDKVILTSEHSKYAFEHTTYVAKNQKTGEEYPLKTETPLIPVNYAVRPTVPEPVELDLETDFNFLVMAQWSIRKNIENTIKWFVEEFKDEEVGLLVKTNCANNSTTDKAKTLKKLKRLLEPHSDRKCKVYLLHGDMSDEEVLGLYEHPKVKAMVSLTHGEGFGLPLFEAAQRALPIVATDWSGQCDFLYMPVKNKKGKIKNKGVFARVPYDLKPIQKEAYWDGVLLKDSLWAYPKHQASRAAMRECYKEYNRFESQAKKLQKHIIGTFTEERQYAKFVEAAGLISELPEVDYVFVNDVFANEYIGGAELSLQTLIDSCEAPSIQIKSSQVDERVVEVYKDKVWVFANFTQTTVEIFNKIIDSGIRYYISESDYKYCEHRLPQLCKVFAGGDDCDCGATNPTAKLYEKFYNSAQTLFFRSHAQMKDHKKALNLTNPNIKVLSALFPEDFFKKIESLRNAPKDKKWIVSNSPSWVKGATDAEKWCKENEKEYAKIHGISHDEMLTLLASSEGLCFLPKGSDTCPRLVIEAKLLGCKLQLNDNVLHAKEKWFDTEDIEEIEKHLREQPKKFWDVVQAA
tara:strand:- start:7214 stop:9295 length:2082 start_codon:yes stop_codon:yes gene_type:complete